MATKNRPKAIDRLIAIKGEVDELLAQLQRVSDDHFGAAPDKVNWGHVGDAAHVRDMLRVALGKED